MLLDKIKKTIEALLFMKGEEGLSVEFFSTFMEVEYHEAENMLNIFIYKNDKFMKSFGNEIFTNEILERARNDALGGNYYEEF